jgi:hypothetical protein
MLLFKPCASTWELAWYLISRSTENVFAKAVSIRRVRLMIGQRLSRRSTGVNSVLAQYEAFVRKSAEAKGLLLTYPSDRLEAG